jgi:bifunctional DNA-binding transcriptional regulator/antitoxin component of YhaV-PrlF toxin-antitoxin module
LRGTSKHQTTIPKAVRDNLGLSIEDTIYPAKQNFLKYRNTIIAREGDIAADMDNARNLRMEKYQ